MSKLSELDRKYIIFSASITDSLQQSEVDRIYREERERIIREKEINTQ